MQLDISFATSKTDSTIISKIVDRALVMFRHQGVDIDRMSIHMDIVATHANGNPLRLRDLLGADDFNFAHDIFGIYRHLDRDTGKLGDHFSPRFTCRAEAA